RNALLVAALSLGLVGCNQGAQQETIGTLFGAALGGWVGSKIDNDGIGGAAAIATGTVVGGFVGGSIGRKMDEVDQLRLAQAQQRALYGNQAGQPQQWYNPNTGNYGTVTAGQTVQAANGQYCREYTQTIVVGGQQQDAYGRACQQPDGSWQIVS
ncbi:MAG: RT0821/Lpp0805 family surface protein, partial [Pseudomonadota bacterium]